MKWKTSKKDITRRVWLLSLIGVLFVSTIFIPPTPAKAANFQMRTGYYVGKGAGGPVSVSGIGFQPDLVIIRTTASASAIFKTSAMPALNTGYFGGVADDLTGRTILDSDGFTVEVGLTQSNVQNTYFQWTAFGGSDCSATGNFCVGSYIGNGTSSQAITTGFQPRLVINKRTTSTVGHFRTASMPANRTEYFTSATANTTGALIASLDANGFTIGATDNLSSSSYHYIAFGGSTRFNEGVYTGTGGDNIREIRDLGFKPGAVFIKNSTSATSTSRRTVFSTTFHHDHNSSYLADALPNIATGIMGMESSSFLVGALANVNEYGASMYWFAFGGDPPPQATGGTFTYEEGVYTGTGAAWSVTGLGFKPDFILIKADSSTAGVMRTSMHQGDATSYLGGMATHTGGITSLDSDGFSLGTSTYVNNIGETYRWQAFGNAYNPNTLSGAEDFAVGAFTGSGTSSRDIVGLPFRPDLVIIRSHSAYLTTFSTSLHMGYSNTFDGAGTLDGIRVLSSGGFQLGLSNDVNRSNTVHFWVAFKQSDNFKIGSYTGDGVDERYIPIASFHPDMLLIKSNINTKAAIRSQTFVGDSAQIYPMSSTPDTTNIIEQLNGGGFTVGTRPEVNTSGVTYRYLAWRKPLSGTVNTSIVDTEGAPVVSPEVGFEPFATTFGCGQSTATLGTSSQRIRVSNLRTAAGWTTSIAATNGPTAMWANSGATFFYDYNDPTSSGCEDGSDADSEEGQLTVLPTMGTLTPETSCSNTNISLGSNQAFIQGSIDSVTLANSAIGADTNCYWDITGIGLEQTIPSEQYPDTYKIELTITTTAS